MAECTADQLTFPSFDRRRIEAGFGGADISSDGGILLLRQIDRRLGLTQAISEAIPDPRTPERIEHSQLQQVRQRIYGLAHGYEDLNDHDTLRHDPAWQTAVDRDAPLASSPTLCRLEARSDRDTARDISRIFVEQFISSFDQVPTELILDFDATDDRVHGMQEQRFFHGYYRDWCFLPLYVFCGEQLLVSYLRPSNIDPARHAWAILKLLTARLRQQWPQVRIILRADAGFCRWKMLRWCERHEVDYVVGLAKNKRLLNLAQPLMQRAEQAFEKHQCKQRKFRWIQYRAGTWDRSRRVIVKAEHHALGANPRFVISTLKGRSQQIYDEIYCARGEMENRIKEQQLGLFADRTSCHRWWPNQLRLLLSSAAYVLMESIRRLGLAGTELARAQVGTIRLKLLKIGTIILRNTRRIRLRMSRTYPYQQIYLQVAQRLTPG